MQLRRTRGVVAGSCAIVVALVLLVVAAGCGGDSSSDASAGGAEETGIPDSPPKLDIPPGLPPKKLVVKDLNEGTGTAAKKGDKVTIHYYCIVWEDGTEYANSWRYVGPPTFVLGSHRVLRGLNMAIPGMKEGGGREVLIPDTLVFYPEAFSPPLGRLAALICKTYLVDVLDEKPQR